MAKKTKARKSTAQASAKKTASTCSSRQRIYKATGKPITAKQEAFAQEYALGKTAQKNKLNGTQSYATVYGTDSKVSSVESTRTLGKPSVQNEVQRLLEESGQSVGECIALNKRNAHQTKHYPTSQKAVETALKLHGVINDEPKTQVNVALVIE